MKIKLDIDAKKLTKLMKDDLVKQARFASAKTLTGAAFASRKKLQKMLHVWLRINRPFLPKSIVANRATPKKLYSEVGFLDRATLTPLLERGGRRKPQGKHIAIPTDNLKRSARGTITKAKRPKQLLARKDTFHAVINGTNGIWQRDKRGNHIKLVYLFEKDTDYDAGTIKFYKTIEITAPRYIKNELLKNLERAIATRKR